MKYALFIPAQIVKPGSASKSPDEDMLYHWGEVNEIAVLVTDPSVYHVKDDPAETARPLGLLLE